MLFADEVYKNAMMESMQGSLFWMAPEVLQNDQKGYSAKVDIWSLGCTVLEMFAGKRPWEEDDSVSVMFKVSYVVLWMDCFQPGFILGWPQQDDTTSSQQRSTFH